MLDKLQIGAIRYTVEEVDDLHKFTAEGTRQWLQGQVLYHEATIRIDSELAADVKIVALWHEAIHALLDQAGIDAHDENAVIALGYGIVRLLRDNPGLVHMTTEDQHTRMILQAASLRERITGQ